MGKLKKASISDNARLVLERRYLERNERGEIVESVEGMFSRVAKAIAKVDENYDKNADVEALEERFYNLMAELEFVPNSPTLMNAGRPLGQLSACFVLPVEDSMEGIFDSVKNAALIHKSGGGTGMSFSRLRPSGDVVKTTGGVASGPISFMKVFNMATEAVKQGGTRRGANMGILRVDHPDIMEFIECKTDTSQITNFNISVGITEKFMEAAKAGENYDLIHPKTKVVVGELNAAMVYEKIVSAAWQTGEPGIIFLDRINKSNPVPHLGEVESTNPCGEQPLLPFESCNLGSINLMAVMDKKKINYKKLEQIVRDSVHFLDNVIDANKYPLDIIDVTTKNSRKIGLGVMGFADMLLTMGVSYASEEGVKLAGEVMGFINDTAKDESRKLAKQRGNFPAYAGSVFEGKTEMRNATVTTIAPTGTISMVAGVSSGVEPVFAFVYTRTVMDKTVMHEVNPVLKQVLGERGLYTEELMAKISKAGTLQTVEEIPQDIKDVFVCAQDISPEYHIKIQAKFQEHVDNAVSKTVNFVNSATKEDVKAVYNLAYETGCKGVTIYRDGSRAEQVLSTGSSAEATPTESAPVEVVATPRARPDVTIGFTEKVQIGCGNLYITVNYDDEGLVEVFTNTGRHGGCPSQSEATSRLVSMALRSGMDPKIIIEQLRGIRCPSTIRQKGMKATSCPDAIARVIAKVLNYQETGSNGTIPVPEAFAQTVSIPTPSGGDSSGRNCPECSGSVEHEGGCVICRNCGYSKCG